MDSVVPGRPWEELFREAVEEGGQNIATVRIRSRKGETSAPRMVKLSPALEPITLDLCRRLRMPLETLAQCRTLVLKSFGLSAPSGHAIAYVVRHMTLARDINLANNPELKATGLVPILEALAIIPSLRSLNLSNTSCFEKWHGPGVVQNPNSQARRRTPDPSALTAMSKALKGRQLRALALGGNDLRWNGIHLLSTLWQARGIVDSPTTIEELDLSFNALSDQGAQELARSLEPLASLVSLSVEGNAIRRPEALASYICTAPRLRIVSLRHNRIDSAGLKAMAMAFLPSMALESLDLGHNCLVVGGDSGVNALARTIVDGGANRMHTLLVDGNSLTAAHRAALHRALRGRERLFKFDTAVASLHNTGDMLLRQTGPRVLRDLRIRF